MSDKGASLCLHGAEVLRRCPIEWHALGHVDLADYRWCPLRAFPHQALAAELRCTLPVWNNVDLKLLVCVVIGAVLR